MALLSPRARWRNLNTLTPPNRGFTPFALLLEEKIIDAEASSTGRSQKEEDERVERGRLAPIEDRRQSLWDMKREVGDCHLSREQESHGLSEKANHNC